VHVNVKRSMEKSRTIITVFLFVFYECFGLFVLTLPDTRSTRVPSSFSVTFWDIVIRIVGFVIMLYGAYGFWKAVVSKNRLIK